MDNFKVIYRILWYLEKAMDYDEVDIEQISAHKFRLTEQRWTALMEMLANEGYVDGISVRRSLDVEVAVSVSSPRITLKGLEYLQENPKMQKAAAEAKGMAGIIT